MGANFSYNTYTGNDREAIRKEWDSDVENSLYESGHMYSGEIGMLAGPIHWCSMDPFPTLDKAEEYLEENHSKWDPGMAVPYIETDGNQAWMIGGWCSS